MRNALLVVLALTACGRETSPGEPPHRKSETPPPSRPAATPATVASPAACGGQPFYKLEGDAVERPVVVHREAADFDHGIARTYRVSGPAILTVFIDAAGHPCAVQVERGVHPDLDSELLTSLMRWTFKPARYQGHAVGSVYRVTVNIDVR